MIKLDVPLIFSNLVKSKLAVSKLDNFWVVSILFPFVIQNPFSGLKFQVFNKTSKVSCRQT